MNLRKRFLSVLLTLCMALTLLPGGALAAEPGGSGVELYDDIDMMEVKQLRSFDPSKLVAYFEDGDAYQVMGNIDTDLGSQKGNWFLCRIMTQGDGLYVVEMTLIELDAEIAIFVDDLELDGENVRTSGSDGAFESTSSFELPVKVAVMNVSLVPEDLRQEVKDDKSLGLELRSLELQAPRGFTLDFDKNQSWGDPLYPGDKREYEGTLKWDTSYLHIQNGNADYTVYAMAAAKTGQIFKGEGSFTVSLTSMNAGDGVEYEGILFPYLDQVTDTKSAVDAVERMTGGMTSEQRISPTGVDLATLYAEAAAARATSKTVGSGEILLNAAAVSGMEAAAAETSGAMESALMGGGVTAARYLSSTVTLDAAGSDKISLKIDPDILTTKVDKIRVETSTYALTLKTSDLAEDLKEPITITAETLQDQKNAAGVGASFSPGKINAKTTVKISLPNTQMTNPITVSLPRNGDDTTYQAVVKTDGTATASKFNPATVTMDGKINSSGTYTVRTNEKSFSDISNKSAEMQKAILYLTSKGIINGTSAAKFSPDSSISRQQIAALLMRALGKVDNTAETTFTDVSKSSALYHAIASSQKHKIINGYSDNTFRGTNVISKAQIVTVSGRVLTSEMNYKAPGDINAYLGKYSDTVPEYARSMAALATREGLVVYRTDGTFSGEKNMTRGDAAIILYRLFQKIW